MFYFIIAVILVLFYLFIAPKNIKGTLNLVALVFLLVAVAILVVVGATKLFQAPVDMWLAFGMVFLGAWALYDLYVLDKSTIPSSKQSSKKRKPYRYH